jgi:phosphate transport system substrate-binding protein
MPADFRVSITDAEGKAAYPISGFTYILVYQNLPKDKGAQIVKLLRWALRDGQKLAEPLAYAPLPKELVNKVEEKLKTIQLQ